ncbi:MAG: DNA gyrase inhibitor YacG [Saccharospirillaceae bacterium]|nr:DNA gyrase inhibitor YacG [Pseudomonadales bacterium]NRB78206.1 DNA gyrase inhibitor YacG [Saccharospirillaceae bacterium]
MSTKSVMIKCPKCQKEHVYDTKNEFRPFCSERCKLIDFNGWASDLYSVASEEGGLSEGQLDFGDD